MRVTSCSCRRNLGSHSRHNDGDRLRFDHDALVERAPTAAEELEQYDSRARARPIHPMPKKGSSLAAARAAVGRTNEKTEPGPCL